MRRILCSGTDNMIADRRITAKDPRHGTAAMGLM